MNGRIFVLLAATGLFVHVWNANHPAHPDRAPSVAAVPEYIPSTTVGVELTLDMPQVDDVPVRSVLVPVREVGVETKKLVEDEVQFGKRFQAIVRSKAAPSVSSLWIEPAFLPERLPQGIAAGLYQVVDNYGHVTLAQITSERLAQAGIVAESKVRDLYVHQLGNQRWYFIRQGEISDSYPTIAPAPIVPSTVTKSAPAAESNPPQFSLMRNKIVHQLCERWLVQSVTKLVALRVNCLAVMPEPARDLGVNGVTALEQTLHRMADLAMQKFPHAELLHGIDWTLPNQEIQDLPSVAVPGIEVELPVIPLRTVRQLDPAFHKPL